MGKLKLCTVELRHRNKQRMRVARLNAKQEKKRKSDAELYEAEGEDPAPAAKTPRAPEEVLSPAEERSADEAPPGREEPSAREDAEPDFWPPAADRGHMAEGDQVGRREGQGPEEAAENSREPASDEPVQLGPDASYHPFEKLNSEPLYKGARAGITLLSALLMLSAFQHRFRCPEVYALFGSFLRRLTAALFFRLMKTMIAMMDILTPPGTPSLGTAFRAHQSALIHS
jgi:hypothetical protein